LVIGGIKVSKNETKDKKIKRFIKLINEGKLDKVLEKTNVNDVGDLFDVGLLLGKNKVHDVAEKIFDRVVQINPNLEEAWYYKGVVLGNLGKYDEEIKCYDRAIKINPTLAEAYGNKGIAFLSTRI